MNIYREEFNGWGLRRGIPSVITDEIIFKAACYWCRSSVKNGVFNFGSKFILDDTTDPNKNFRMAIGAMNLSYLDDCSDVDAYCEKEDYPMFEAMIAALPEKWDSHALIDLHWCYLRKGEAENPDLFELVDDWLINATYGSNG